MAAGVITPSAHPEALRREMARKTAAGAENRLKKALWKEIVNFETTKVQTTQFQDIQTMPMAADWVQFSERQMADWTQGYAQSITQFQYGLEVLITKPMIKFSQENMQKQAISKMLDAGVDSMNVLASAMYEYGSSSDTVPTINGRAMFSNKTGDGQQYFDTDHTWRDSAQTVSNLSTAGLGFTEDNVFTVYNNIRRWKNDQGVPMNCRSKTAMLPPDLMKAASKVLKSRLEPGTNNNAINTAPEFVGTDYLVNDFLSDTGDWYVLTDKTEYRPKWLQGWAPETGVVDESRYGAIVVTFDYSVGVGYHMPFGAYKVL